MDPVLGYALDGTFSARFPNTSVVQYNATYSKGVRLSEAIFDASGAIIFCRALSVPSRYHNLHRKISMPVLRVLKA